MQFSKTNQNYYEWLFICPALLTIYWQKMLKFYTNCFAESLNYCSLLNYCWILFFFFWIFMMQMLIDHIFNPVTWHFLLLYFIFLRCCYVELWEGTWIEYIIYSCFAKGENIEKTWNHSKNLFGKKKDKNK